MSPMTVAAAGRLRYIARCAYLTGRRWSSEPFERRQGIDTASAFDLDGAGLGHPERVRYEPSGWLNLKRALRACAIGTDDVLLDYGCGKGRVLLAAARLPFARVIGVELVPELCEIARRNLQVDRDRRRCGAVEVVHADVTTWDVPDDVTVAFMFNPFRGRVFEVALEHLLASLDRHPRGLRLIYSVPMEEARVVATGRARLLRDMSGVRPGVSWSRKMGVRIYELT